MAALDSVRALMLIRAYRVRGHLEADLDPLGLAKAERHPELDPASYGFSESDMDRPIFLHGVLGLETATMREIMQVVRRDYCGKLGLEFMHLQDPDQKAWVQMSMEGVIHRTKFKPEAKREILERLTAADMAVPMWMMADIDHGDVTSDNPDDYDPYAWARAVPKVSPIIHIKQSLLDKGGQARSHSPGVPRRSAFRILSEVGLPVLRYGATTVSAKLSSS